MVVCDTGEPLPTKLVQALHAFSFVELHWFLPATLVPPGLNLEDCAHGNCHCCRPTQAKRSRKTVADVSTWLLCFNRYVAAMCSVYPRMLPQMLAYSNMIIQAQLQFSGDGWLTYDRMFRIAAASSRNTNWRNVDASLYARFVSCQPRRGGVCQLCCSAAHRSTTCPWGVNEPAPPEQSSAVQPPWYPRLMQPWSSGPPPSLQWPPICTSWNAGNCRFRGSCNYRHICSFCFLPGHRNKECPTPPPGARGAPGRAMHPRIPEPSRTSAAPLSHS